MGALVDVNVLVALFDPTHIHHEPAHQWFAEHRDSGWATCPITENGLVRVLSHPSYPGRRTTLRDAVHRLSVLRQSEGHEFWPDEISICDSGLFRHEGIGSHRKVTDLYLLALAVANSGRLVTFDRSISVSALVNADKASLTVIE